MTSLMRTLIAAVLVVLGGCAAIGPQEAQRYYVLDPAPAAGQAPSASRTATLLVAPTTVSGFYDTQDIVYSRTPGMRAYYQFHAWAERPGRRLSELLLMRLERAEIFKTVATAVSGVRGDVVLTTHLADFYHDAGTAPGSVRVVVTAELTDPVRRVLLARRTFERSAPAPSYDATGAVQAFNIAVAGLLEDLTVWVATQGGRPRQ